MTTLNFILLIGYFGVSGLNRLHRRRVGFDKPFVVTRFGFCVDIFFFVVVSLAIVLAVLRKFNASDFINVFFGGAILQVSERILARHQQCMRAAPTVSKLRNDRVEATAGSRSDA